MDTNTENSPLQTQYSSVKECVDAALSLVQQGFMLKALNLVEGALSDIEAGRWSVNIEKEDKAYLFLALSQFRWQSDRVQEALEPGQTALDLLADSTNSLLYAKALVNMAVIKKESAHYEEALENLGKAETIAKEANDTIFLGRIYGNTANVYSILEQFDKSVEYILKSDALFRASEDYKGQIINLINLIDLNLDLSDNANALKHLNRVLDIIDRVGQPGFVAQTYEAVSRFYFRLNLYEQSLQYSQLAYDIVKTTEEVSVVNQILRQISNSLIALERYEESLEILENLTHSLKKGEKNFLYRKVFRDMGLVKHKLFQYEQAEEYLQLALSLGVSSHDSDLQITTNAYLAELYANPESTLYNTRKASLYYKKTIAQLELQQKTHNYSQVMMEASKFFKSVKKYKLSLECLEKAMKHEKKVFDINSQKTLEATAARAMEREKQALEEKNAKILLQQQQISEQNRLLSEKNAKLEELTTFKEMMTASVIHDLKNPLNVILNVNEMPPDSDKVATIRQAANDMLTLVSNVLDVYRFEESAIAVESRNISIADIVASAKSKVEFILRSKQLVLSVNTASPSPIIRCDRSLIERVFVNAFSNAIKYSHFGGTITVNCTIEENLCRVEVVDEGEGADESYLPHIFNKFSQESGGKDLGKTSSTGLGLTFCKLAIEAHGGTIQAKSIKGEGFTLSFTLPLGDTQTDAEKVQPIAVEESHTLVLSALEKNIIATIKQHIVREDVQLYEYSTLMDILDTYDYAGEAIIAWRKHVENCLYVGDIDKFWKMFEV